MASQNGKRNGRVPEVNFGKLTSMHFHAWKKGLKTGMYYLRTKSAADAIKFTVEKQGGMTLEQVGYFNPIPAGKQRRLELNLERIDYWVSKGAQLSPTAARGSAA